MSFLSSNAPVVIVGLISLVIGLLMVLVFGYTSNQKAIHIAKEHLKAHLLALRLFQDQIPVVIRSYGRIFLSTGNYLQLAFKPLLFVILPLTFMVVQLDRYLGWTPMEAGQPFLVKAQISNPEMLNAASLQLPQGLTTTSPAVHIPSENEIAWRVVAEKDGNYDVNVQASDQTLGKRVVVASGLARLSPVRLRGQFWERIFVSGEPALPQNSPIQAISVQYPSRSIAFAGVEWNWIWLFLVLSMIAGFFFKSVLGIEI
ncbi:MAG: hypothetical protein ACRD3L_17350 [Terriglobales bacterium]